MQIDLVALDDAERASVLALLGPRLPLRSRDDLGVEPPPGGVLWVHGDPPALDESTAAALRAWVDEGGRVLLTGPAARLCGALTGEPVPPTVTRAVWPRNVDPREVRGVMALPRQPLFHRFPGGVPLIRAAADLPRVETVWEAPSWPARGRVLGVEKLHLGCDVNRAVLVEHEVGRGRVLSLGAPMRLCARDRELDEARGRFLGDVFDYLMSDHAAERSPSWPRPGSPRGARIVHVGSGSAPMVALPAERVAEDDPLRSDLDAERLADDPFFTLVTPDAQAVHGRLKSGIGEVWARSFCVLRDLRIEVATAEDIPLRPLADVLDHAWVHPDEIGWRAQVGSAVLTVRLARAADDDGFALVVETAGASVILRVSARIDLRPSWPYPAELIETAVVRSARSGASVTFGERLFGARSALVFDRKPQRAVVRDASADGDGAALVEVVREFAVAEGDDLVAWFAGQPIGWEEDGAVPRAPDAVALGCEGTASITTGDPTVDRCLARVQAGLAGFVAPIDGRNSGLIAGRPDHPWFFTREALICDQVLLPLGERALARANLALCARFQDPVGKVHDQVTTLGVAHHDAADTTPMFVDAVGRYLAWTGDLAFVAELWPAVARALDHMERFDRDGVYENAGNGYGVVEEGTLADGVRLEARQAALVWRAWSAAATVAEALGDADQARRCAERAATVHDTVRALLLLEDGSFGHAVRVDGSIDRRPAATTVVPWLLGLGEDGHEDAALRRFASAAHQADWGSRMLPADDPAYDPAASQAGSVWPVLTGWTATTDLRFGRPDSAWLRLLPLLRSVDDFAPGLIGSGCRGDVYATHGADEHRAWSHAAVLAAFVDGICGFRLSPRTGRVVLEPTLPGALDRIGFGQLRIGETVLSGEVRREPDGCDLVISLRTEGAPLELEVAPFVPAPARVDGATRDGDEIEVTSETVGDGLRLRVRIELADGATELRFRVTPDLQLSLAPEQPVPGETSRGVRFLGRRSLDDGAVALDFECAHVEQVPLRLPGREVVSVEGAELVRGERPYLRLDPGPGEGHRPLTVTLRF